MGINGFDIEYNGYTAKFELDEDGYFYGKLIGIKDLVMILANDELDAEEQTRLAVDDYVESLKELERYK